MMPDLPKQIAYNDVAGFYCYANNSPNATYIVCYCDGAGTMDKWQDGDLALIKEGVKLYRVKIKRPSAAHVSDDGVVVCVDKLVNNEASSNCMILNNSGEVLFQHKVGAVVGETAISADSTIAIFDTYYSDNKDCNQIFILNVSHKTILGQFERWFEMSSATIDTLKKRIRFVNQKGIIYETDYVGNQTNSEEFDQLVWKLGSVYDKLRLFEKFPVQERNKNNTYVPLLEAAISDPDISASYQAEFYKKLGEFYETQNDAASTVKYFEKAIAADPKIGVKRKLDKYKRNLKS